MLITILIFDIALVAWSLHLMQEAFNHREFSLMLAGTLVALVPAGTSITLAIPAGNEIIAAKGAYSAIVPNCAFYVALPCIGGPLGDSVVCSLQCGDYKAKYILGTGILIYN